MNTIELFFDYVCPFCYQSFQDLELLQKQNPQLNVVFRPCEIHPRPERYGKHSDLMIQGMYLAEDLKPDLWEYNRRMFQAKFVDRINFEDPDILTDYIKDFIDSKVFLEALASQKYLTKLQQGNEHAFTENQIEVVPHYITSGSELASIEGVGIPRNKLEEFLKDHNFVM